MAKETKKAGAGAQKTTVTLVNKNASSKKEEAEKEFDLKHAEELLAYQQSKGYSDWELAADSGYKYENGTIEPTDTGASQKSGEQGSDQ